VEIAYLRGSRGIKGCLHCLFRRDAPHKPLSVRSVQFPLIYSLRIGSWTDLGSILAILTDPIQDRSKIDLAEIIAEPAPRGLIYHIRRSAYLDYRCCSVCRGSP
jgi:hypothetical protein